MKADATGIRRMITSGKRSRLENMNGEGAIIAQPAIFLWLILNLFSIKHINYELRSCIKIYWAKRINRL
jgi:hypothetical protein